ncbi:MAG: cation:proton antiporter [Gammaproteobacteria bacterium]|nr:cation:proton antiporter [Gammaproteobacteria bacterium]
MNFELVAIALGDVVWVSIAFAMGFLSRGIGLPPLVGYLTAGFVLNLLGFASGDMLEKLSDLGITLLLFTVGLKLNLGTLARPQVWAVTGIHTSLVVLAFSLAIYGLAVLGATVFSALDLKQALLIAFALSFSSTVFVVKTLEDRGELRSLHGRIAIGILIMQDIAAVAFVAVSANQWPSWWALLLLLLILLRPLLHRILVGVGHGELLVLYGFVLALGGAELFEIVGVKGDLGALFVGVLIANHYKGEELGKVMLNFKDLFLLGFFLSIGFSGQLTPQTLIVGVLITPLIFAKSALFYVLLTGFRLRARTALLSSLSLTNYSEFGLIVASISVANGWLSGDWMVILSIGMSISFVIAAWLNPRGQRLYTRYQPLWQRIQRSDRLADDRLLDIGGARVAIIGIGGVGTGAFDHMRQKVGNDVVGIDIDTTTVANQQAAGRAVIQGDPSDADFWDRVHEAHSLELVLLTLPKVDTSLAIIRQLRDSDFDGVVAAIARFPDEEVLLRNAGVQTVFNIYSEAGVGFASHVISSMPDSKVITHA